MGNLIVKNNKKVQEIYWKYSRINYPEFIIKNELDGFRGTQGIKE